MSQGWRTYQEFQQESEEAGLNAEPADAPQRAGAFDISCEDLDLFCESHLAFVQNLWNDSDRFDGVVASGRYLKLCNLTEWISDYDERAWERVKSEILAARQKSASSLS